MINFKSKFIQILIWLILGVFSGIVYTLFKPVFVILILSIAIGLGFWFFLKKDEQRFITSIYFAALAIRIIATIFLVGMELSDPLRADNSGGLSGDEYVFMRRGLELSKFGLYNIRTGRVVTSFGAGSRAFGINAVSIMSSIFYSAFGFNLFALKMLTCMLGALTAVLIYYLSKKLFNIKIAKVASVLVAFYPSLIRWSAQVIKEPFIIPLILIIFLAVSGINLKKWYLSLVIAILTLILYSLQPLIAVMLFLILLLCPLLLLYFKRINLIKIFITILSLFVLVVYISTNQALQDKIKRGLLTMVQHSYQQNIGGKSGYSLYPLYILNKQDPFEHINHLPVFYRHILPPPEIIETAQIYQGALTKHRIFYGSFFISYLLGLVYVIFSPFPWSISTVLQLQAYPQIILTYCLIPFIVLGIILCIRYRFKETFLILFFYFGVISLLAISEGNVGGLFRHRDWVAPFTLMFGAIGLVKVFNPSGIAFLKNIIIRNN